MKTLRLLSFMALVLCVQTNFAEAKSRSQTPAWTVTPEELKLAVDLAISVTGKGVRGAGEPWVTVRSTVPGEKLVLVLMNGNCEVYVGVLNGRVRQLPESGCEDTTSM